MTPGYSLYQNKDDKELLFKAMLLAHDLQYRQDGENREAERKVLLLLNKHEYQAKTNRKRNDQKYSTQ